MAYSASAYVRRSRGRTGHRNRRISVLVVLIIAFAALAGWLYEYGTSEPIGIPEAWNFHISLVSKEGRPSYPSEIESATVLVVAPILNNGADTEAYISGTINWKLSNPGATYSNADARMQLRVSNDETIWPVSSNRALANDESLVTEFAAMVPFRSTAVKSGDGKLITALPDVYIRSERPSKITYILCADIFSEEDPVPFAVEESADRWRYVSSTRDPVGECTWDFETADASWSTQPGFVHLADLTHQKQEGRAFFLAGLFTGFSAWFAVELVVTVLDRQSRVPDEAELWAPR